MRYRFAGLVLAVLFSALPGTAEAALTRTYGYAFDAVWSATVRLLVVDRGCKIIEKDPETGYIVFELKESTKDDKTARGSAELIRDKDSASRPIVKVKFEIAGKSDLTHTILHDRLTEKMRAEYGPPFGTPPPSATGREAAGVVTPSFARPGTGR